MKKTIVIVGLVFGLVGLVNIVDLIQANRFLAPAYASNEKVITISDGQSKTNIFTTKKTVAEVLKQAKIELNSADIVEPGLKQPIGDGFFINIYRATPITVVDGTQRLKIITPYKQVDQIINHSGIVFYPEDRAEIKINNTSPNQDIGVELIVTRAKVINLDLYGQVSQVRTQAQTVEQFLGEKKIVLGKDDYLNYKLSQLIENNFSLQIWNEGETEQTDTEKIAFKTRTIHNYDKPAGQKQIITKGQDGERVVTYKIRFKNDKVVSKQELKATIIKQPVEQVEEIGMKVALPPGSHQDWMRQAGIRESDFGFVEFIISHESGWGHLKWNYGGSGAYGLCQALPARKMASAGADYMTNPITQLRWCNGYAVGRYGSWANAYQFWTKNKWW